MGGPFKLPIMAPWPQEKLTTCDAFTYTGVDYFGPLYTKDKGDVAEKKVWVCLFTCVATRAVHLELIADMSTEQFLMCFRRFVATHRKPEMIISDNATNFKLAKSTLEKVWHNVIRDKDIQSYVAQQGIKWKFIMQYAPWQGGFYERMVGIVKSSLKKTISRKVILTFLQLATLLSEIQAVVNSRPLTYGNDDINSDIVLTPSHFLRKNTCIGTPDIKIDLNEDDPDFSLQRVSTAESLLRTWKKQQRCLDQFWTIWRNNYLPSLRERTQHHVVQGRIKSSNDPKPGDIVLIKDNLSRGNWKMGRIQSLILSQDGQCRNATILLPSKKTLNRPISLLYPIECPPLPISGDNQPVDSTDDTDASQPVPEDDQSPGDSITSQPVTEDDQSPGGSGTAQPTEQRQKRKAAIKGRENVKNYIRAMIGLDFKPSKHDALKEGWKSSEEREQLPELTKEASL